MNPDSPESPIEKIHPEDETLAQLSLDDATILARRYRLGMRQLRLARKKNANAMFRFKSHWTRCNDAVQEHYMSHVTLDSGSYALPAEIYALKASGKHSWILYKKRECERRKRLRKKLEQEKNKEKNDRPANILLSMVDMCEQCKKLYITVNLFWGITLCDTCYFDEHVIRDIMFQKKKLAKQKHDINSDNIVEEVLKLTKAIPKRKRVVSSAKPKEFYFDIHSPSPSPPRLQEISDSPFSPASPPVVSPPKDFHQLIDEWSSDDADTDSDDMQLDSSPKNLSQYIQPLCAQEEEDQIRETDSEKEEEEAECPPTPLDLYNSFTPPQSLFDSIQSQDMM